MLNRLTIVGAIFLSWAATPAEAVTLYWAEETAPAIQRAEVGEPPMAILTDSDDPFGPAPFSIEVDRLGGKVYWTDGNNDSSNGQLYRADLDGSNPTLLLEGLQAPQDLALDPVGGKVYVAETGNGNRILSANLDGSNLAPLFSVTASVLEFDPVLGQLYYSTGTTIRRIDGDGMNDTELFDTVEPNPSGPATALTLDVANNFIYWSEPSQGTIQRGDLNELDTSTAIVTSVPGVQGLDIELSTGQLYWSRGDQVFRSDADGLNQQLLYTQGGIGLGRLSAVPEPSALALLAVGGAAMLAICLVRRHLRCG